MTEKKHRRLSDDCDSRGEVGKLGLLERTAAFTRPLIFMTNAQMESETQ